MWRNYKGIVPSTSLPWFSKATQPLGPRPNPLYVRSLELLFVLSLLGLSVSCWAHIVALCGIDPSSKFHGLWLFQVILSALLLPVAVEVLSRRNHLDVLRSPRWMRLTLGGLLVYYGLHFYFFLYWSVENLKSSSTWVMFSSGWLVLFALTTVYYWIRSTESRTTSSPCQGEPV